MSDDTGEFDIETGRRLQDRYRVDGEIGRGGFATVYKAHDVVIDRRVAIKVLSLQQLDDEQKDRALKRFLREARLAAKISHAGIVDIYDFGELDDPDAPYIVMERLDGMNLYRRIHTEGPVVPAVLIPNYSQVLEALGQAHQQNIVHKDLKPGNIFLHLPGTVGEIWKLVDFGVAHMDGPTDERLTQTGFLSGTPQYLPPEYIQEQRVSPRMDVYQMGLTLVEALTGEAVVSERKPFKAAMQHVEGKLEIPETIINSPLGKVLQRALNPDPERRFETGLQFARALANVNPDDVPVFGEGDPEERAARDTIRWAAIDGPDN